MLTISVLIPLLGAGVLALRRGWSERGARTTAIVISAIPLVLMIIAWLRFDPSSGELFQLVEEASWIPTLGVAWRMGVDGISLALASLTALLFVASVAYPAEYDGRHRQYLAWFLFLEAVSLGLFLTVDLLVFYVFFDLSLVGMFFLIGRWGHGADGRGDGADGRGDGADGRGDGDAERAALKFFLYTFAGSLVMLLGILGIYLGTDPLTFDMATIIEQQPLAGEGLRAGLALLALGVGLGIKTPVVPFHTWLPPAHVEAPAPASAILAGVLLKMGTYGLIRIPYAMMRETFGRYALVIAIIAVISIVYGALVAFGQDHLKRRIAYTSVNHMGYAVLGIAAAGAMTSGAEEARRLALTGATVEMVAHGLVTGALFLITGSFWQRTREYDMDVFGGLASRTPLLTGAAVLAAFASLGMPGLAHFVAEFQVFVGTFSVYPWLAAIGLLGVLITAALFLQLLTRVFFGELPDRWRDLPDLGVREAVVLGGLSALIVLVGVYPRWLLDTVDASVRVLVGG